MTKIIKVSDETKEKLDAIKKEEKEKLKVNSRISYDEIIILLLKESGRLKEDN